MRFLSLCLLLLLTTCQDPAATTTADSEPTVTPTDLQPADDPLITAIRRRTASIDEGRNSLDQTTVSIACDGIRGTVTVYRRAGEPTFVTTRYRDGEARVYEDDFYLATDTLFFARSTSYNLQFLDQGEAGRPNTKTTTAEYRYYLADGTVRRALRRKYDVYSLRDDNPNPDTLPMEDMPVTGAPPFRYAIARAAIDSAAVPCTVFGK